MSLTMLMMQEATKNNVLKALEIMWKGLLAIFIVIGIVAIVTFIMNDISASRKTGELYIQRLWKKIKGLKKAKSPQEPTKED